MTHKKDTTMKQKRTQIGLVSGICVALLALAGCSPDKPEPPTVMRTPKIIWQDGIEPTSPLETDERVIAARTGEIGLALANNTGDYSIAQLTNHVSKELINLSAMGYRDQEYPPLVYSGPDPWQPLSISGDEKETILLVCIPHVTSRPPEERRVSGFRWDRSSGVKMNIFMSKTDGNWMIDLTERLDGLIPCDPSTIPIGLFDPAPKVPKEGEDINTLVRPPLFWNDEGRWER